MTVIVATLGLVWIRLLCSIRRTASSLYPRRSSTVYQRHAASTASFWPTPINFDIFLPRTEKLTSPNCSAPQTPRVPPSHQGEGPPARREGLRRGRPSRVR